MLKPPQPENIDGYRHPANGLRPEWFDFDKLFRRGKSFPGNQDAAGVGKLFHSARKMHVGASRIIGLIDAMLYRLNDDLSGMDADPYLQIRVANEGHSVLHCQCRKTAANRMILMGLGGAKQRHDPVALRFVDDAVIANHGFIHDVENGLKALHSEFGIAQTIHDTGGVANIGKQNRQVFTLSTLGVKRS